MTDLKSCPICKGKVEIEDAVIHMHEVCGNNSGVEGWTFDVEIMGRGWEE